MFISHVKILNFKSIKEVEIPFDRVGGSFTKIFVGVNESGKSNILEALSYFKEPKDKANYDHFCNQKITDGQSCDLYFSLNYENDEEETLQGFINDKLLSGESNIEVSISNIVKCVSLQRDAACFISAYSYDVKLTPNLYIKKTTVSGKEGVSIAKEEGTGYELLSENNFVNYFGDLVSKFIKEHEPAVSFWEPSTQYLLNDADLKTFKDKISSNKPLYNIFKLSGYEDERAILGAISKVTNSRSRSILVSKLNDSLNEYIGKIWSNNIDLIIEITETGKFSLLIKDRGRENIHDRLSITDRSQGAQHFLSLILSLSIETKNQDRKNELILIDEPETHLHPSGIRDLAEELLKIGQNNFVFLATHSPFMIDKSHKERHFIVKKNKMAITELKRIKDSDNIIDDEVLREAFGIDVYRDLLNPHSVLVEGASDKILLQKALNCLGRNNIGITNGHGSNITTLVSKLNYDDIHIVVVVDDDEGGRNDKEKILKIGGAYTDKNVFTIRDLVGEIVDKGSIEDTLDSGFVKAKFIKYCSDTYNKDIDFEVDSTQPIIKQITDLLKTNKLFSKWDMDAFKKLLSEEFNPNRKSLEEKNPLLKKLAEKIVERIK